MLTSLVYLATRLLGGVSVQRVQSGRRASWVVFAPLTFFFLRLVRLTFLCHSVWLLEHGGYEVAAPDRTIVVTWYLLLLNGQSLGLLFAWGQRELRSLERYFRSLRWLERENAEFLDVWYAAKRDRRALFTLPLFY